MFGRKTNGIMVWLLCPCLALSCLPFFLFLTFCVLAPHPIRALFSASMHEIISSDQSVLHLSFSWSAWTEISLKWTWASVSFLIAQTCLFVWRFIRQRKNKNKYLPDRHIPGSTPKQHPKSLKSHNHRITTALLSAFCFMNLHETTIALSNTTPVHLSVCEQ